MNLEKLADQAGSLDELAARFDAMVRFLGDRSLMIFAADGTLVWLSPKAKDALGARYTPSSDLSRRVREASGAQPIGPLVMHTGVGAQRLALNVVRHGGDTLVFGELIEAEALSVAEARVFEALGRGLSNAQIASLLHLSVSTVKTHVHRILDKLGVGSRVEAALIARGRPQR